MPFLKIGRNQMSLLSSGASLDHDLSKLSKSVLAMTHSKTFSTWGCISSDPKHLLPFSRSYPQAVSINLSLDLHKNGNNHFPTIVFRLKTVTWSARPLSSCQVVYDQLYGLKSLINVTGRHPFLSQWGGREGWVSNVTVIIILLSLFCLMLRHRFIKLIWYAS